MIRIGKTKKYGRGIFATKNISKGELIEASPVLVIDKWEAIEVCSTVINNYVFSWKDDESSALAFGHGSLFNHSKRQNVTYESNFADQTVEFYAEKDIKKGQQLFIDYGYGVKEATSTTNKNRKLREEMLSKYYGTQS